MKITVVLIAGLVLSLSALSSNQFGRAGKVSSDEIRGEIERKLELSHDFFEKSRSLTDMRSPR